MKWSDLTPDQRNRLIHELVFGKADEPCLDGELDEYRGCYWSCTCGWMSDFAIGDGKSTRHTRPIPRYSESLDAAWQIVEKFQDVCSEIRLEQHGKSSLCTILATIYPATMVYQAAAYTAPAAICLAALKVVGEDIARAKEHKHE